MADSLLGRSGLPARVVLQPFSQNSRTPTVAKEFQIGLYDPAEADLEHFWNCCSEEVLGERLYLYQGSVRAIQPINRIIGQFSRLPSGSQVRKRGARLRDIVLRKRCQGRWSDLPIQLAGPRPNSSIRDVALDLNKARRSSDTAQRADAVTCGRGDEDRAHTSCTLERRQMGNKLGACRGRGKGAAVRAEGFAQRSAV